MQKLAGEVVSGSGSGGGLLVGRFQGACLKIWAAGFGPPIARRR